MSRLPFNIVNKSHYFNPTTSKAILSIPSPESHYSRLSKQQGYEMRLYYQFRYCQSHNGQVYYYTLTYNNKSMPSFEGIPCFDYNDLVYFLNGGFKKILLRKYGTNFKYFVGAELGEGKGSRGLESNPHYHVLFFLEDAKDSKYPYIKISPLQFRSLVRKYWQKFDQSVDGFHDYRTTGYGIAKEGDFVGLVSDFRAVSYVCKYVTKDVTLIKAEKKLSKIFFDRYYYNVFNDPVNFQSFLNEVVYPKFIDDDLPDFNGTFLEVCSVLAPCLYKQLGDQIQLISDFFMMFLQESHLNRDYDNFILSIVEDYVRQDINLFRNRFSNKCRISQGVGLYALDFLDSSTFKIPVPAKDGYDMRSINLYYYRKLFYDVKKDKIGNNVYVLNQKGIEYKVNNLERSATRLTDRVNSYLSLIDDKVFQGLYDVGYVPSCYTCLHDFLSHLNSFNSISSVVSDYAYFKLVYEGRFFKIFRDRSTHDVNYPCINFVDDFRRFLQPTYYTSRYDIDGASYFLKNFGEDYLSFSSHSYFSKYSDVFAVFDLLVNYYFINKDSEVERFYKEIREVKKFHDKAKLRSYYTNLFN